MISVFEWEKTFHASSGIIMHDPNESGRRHSMPRVGSKCMIPVFEWEETFHASSGIIMHDPSEGGRRHSMPTLETKCTIPAKVGEDIPCLEWYQNA
jgi:hypothetical protein